MSNPSLSEVFPASPDQFPDVSVAMPEDLRLGAFRTASSRILQGMVAVNTLDKPPEGWRQLKLEEPLDGHLYHAHIFNPDQKITIASSATIDTDSEDQIVVGAVYVHRGEAEPEVVLEEGDERIKHRGSTASFSVRGILGGAGNYYFSRSEHDCEPEIQGLSLGIVAYEGSSAIIQFSEDMCRVSWVPRVVQYAFFDKPPHGDESLVTLSEHVADFLEDVAHSRA